MPHQNVTTTTAHPAPDAGGEPSLDGPPAHQAQPPARRSVVALGAAAALGAAGVATLAGCGSGSSGTSTAAPAGSSTAAGGGGGGGGGALTKLAAVPVGGAVAASGADGSAIIIAQPTAGQVVAFSAKCTHQGCKVMVDGAKLNCPCHGSQFDALSGKVLTGPAAAPLPSVPVKVSGADVVSG